MKTLWQKVYSFFGFWTYTHHTSNYEAHRVVYWWGFGRKWDIFRWNVSAMDSNEAHRRRLIAKDPSILEAYPHWSKPFPLHFE